MPHRRAAVLWRFPSFPGFSRGNSQAPHARDVNWTCLISVNNTCEETTMSILTTLSAKPLILLTLHGAAWPIRTLGHLLSEAAEARGRAVSSCYLTAMGISESNATPGRDRRDAH
jgi:hypothetical protein